MQTSPHRGAGRRTLIATIAASGLVFLAISMTRPLLPVLLSGAGTPPSTVGVLAGLYALLPLVLAIPSGSWIDRVGAGRAAILGSLGVGLSLLAVAMAPSVPIIGASQLVAGQGQLLVVLATQTASTVRVSGRQLERSVGLLLMSTAAVRMVAPSVGAFAAARLSIPWAFAMAGCVALLGIAPALALERADASESPSPRPVDRRHHTATGDVLKALGWIRRDPVMSATFLVTLGILSGEVVRSVFVPLYLTERGHPLEVVGWVASAAGLGNVLARPLLPRLTSVSGGRWPLAVGALVAGGLAIAPFPWVHGVGLYGLLAFVAGAVTGLWPALATVVLAERYPRRDLALALSVRLFANQVAELVGPTLLGMAATAWGLPWVFWGTAAMCGGLALYVGRRMSRRIGVVEPVP